MRRWCVLLLVAVSTGCVRRPAPDTAERSCQMPAPTGPLRIDSVASVAGALRGRLQWADERRPAASVVVRLSRNGWATTTRVVSDTFRIAHVAPGAYEMRTMLFGQQPRVDTVQVPTTGASVLVPVAWVQMLDACGPNVTTVRVEP